MEMLEEAGFADAVHAEPSFNLRTVLRFHGAAVTQISTLLKNFRRPRYYLSSATRHLRQNPVDEAAKQGVDVRFGHGVTAFDNSSDVARLSVATDTGENYELTAKICFRCQRLRSRPTPTFGLGKPVRAASAPSPLHAYRRQHYQPEIRPQ